MTTNKDLIIKRVWAMPNSKTFQIKPIKELVERFIKDKDVIVDPFANSSKYGTITNDLNPEFDTTYHLDALEFLKLIPSESVDVVLYDPPYNAAQATECYKSFGAKKLEVHVSNGLYWKCVRSEVSRILKIDGICLGFGWNTVGINKSNGMIMTEILDVCHGGIHYDTLCTVEVKKVHKTKDEKDTTTNSTTIDVKNISKKTKLF